MKQKRSILTCPTRSRVSKAEGFTLIEVILALAVGSVILTGAVLSIYSIMVGTGRGNSQTVALTDIDQASLAIKKDLLMTQTTDLGATPKSSANLTWTDFTSFGSSNQTKNHSSAYTLSGNQLRRTYDGTLSIVGRKVTSVSFTQSGNFVTVVITANGGGTANQTQTLRFSSHIRMEAIE